jgi:hypothetical protein
MDPSKDRNHDSFMYQASPSKKSQTERYQPKHELLLLSPFKQQQNKDKTPQ